MSRRLAAVVVVVAVAVSMLVADRDPPPTTQATFGRATVAAMPVADAADALSSTWFCAATPASATPRSEASVIVANAGNDRRTGTVAWHLAEGDPTVVPFEVAALGSVELAAATGARSAVVEVDGGEVGVEHRVRSGRGVDVAPCASSASAQWYLANGTTARDATQQLVLFNPFADDAVVDISFSTSEGRDEPTPLQGLPIPPGATEVIELTDVVRRRDVTAASIVTRRGRLVVDRVQSFDGSEGRSGLALTLAAPAPAESWTFPEGFYTEGTTERWHVYNPSEEEALVTIDIVPDDGTVTEPIELTIPPVSQVAVDASETGRVGPDVGHLSTVRSSNGVRVVAERSIDARPPADGQGRRGWTSALGSPLVATRWLLPYGATTGTVDEWVVVVNPGEQPVTFTVEVLTGAALEAVDGLDAVALEPAGRRALQLRTRVERDPLPLLVTATGPVVVERNLYQLGPTEDGVSSAVGIPLP